MVRRSTASVLEQRQKGRADIRRSSRERIILLGGVQAVPMNGGSLPWPRSSYSLSHACPCSFSNDVSDRPSISLQSGGLVMGGYGHSRVREMLFGGTTRTFLDQAAIPVLLAH